MRKYGRDPDHLKILPGLSVIVARDAEVARKDYEFLQNLIHPIVGREILSTMLGEMDLTPYSLDEPLPDPLPPSNGSRGHYDSIVAMARRENLTIRELGNRVAGARGKNVFVGTPAEVADYMEDWFSKGACDGFTSCRRTFPVRTTISASWWCRSCSAAVCSAPSMKERHCAKISACRGRKAFTPGPAGKKPGNPGSAQPGVGASLSCSFDEQPPYGCREQHAGRRPCGVHIQCGIAAALAVLMAIAAPPAGAQQAAAPAVAIDNDDIGGVVRRPERSRGRRLGDRGNARSAGALHQDRRHRRSGPLRHPRSAESQLRRLGARLRPRRFAEGEERARQAAQSDRGAGAERGGGREVLPGDLLVRDDEDPGGRGLRQQGRAEQRQDHRLSQRHEEQRLRRLPSARPARDPHDSEVPHGRGQDATRRPGCAASSPARPART